MEEEVCKECKYYDPYPCSNSCTYPNKHHKDKEHGKIYARTPAAPETITYCYYLKQKGQRVPRYFEGVCDNCGKVFSRHEGGWNGETKYCLKCRPKFEPPPKPIFTPQIIARIKELQRDGKETHKRQPCEKVKPKKAEPEEEEYVRPRRKYVLGHAR